MVATGSLADDPNTLDDTVDSHWRLLLHSTPLLISHSFKRVYEVVYCAGNIMLLCCAMLLVYAAAAADYAAAVLLENFVVDVVDELVASFPRILAVLGRAPSNIDARKTRD